MRRFISGALLCTLTAASVIVPQAVYAEGGVKTVDVAGQQAVANRVIVKLKTSQNISQLKSALTQLGVSIHEQYSLPGKKNKLGVRSAPSQIAVLNINNGLSVKEMITKLQASGLVDTAEPDYVVKAGLTTPSDPSFSSLWAMNNTGQTGGTVDADIDAVEAWDIHTGNDSVVVAVVDTGIDYNHPDLADNIWVNPGEIAGNGIDDDGNGYVDDIHGIDCANNDSDPMDDNNHGTHVAGTIGATGNNGVGVVGVNWTTQLMGLKFLRANGGGAISDAIECLAYAANMAARTTDPVNLKVTNNSWGGGGFSQVALDAFNALGAESVLSAVAAGNDYGNDNDTSPVYPASYDAESIITVASTTHTDGMSSFSNFGAESVDLGAPGSDILSTVVGGGYDSLSGTSMATPHVAGALTYLWSYNPSYSASALKNLVMERGDAIPALAGRTVSGKRLNLFNSIDCDPGTPTLSVLSPRDGFRVGTGGDVPVQVSFSNCGVPELNADISASFSNGDETLVLLDNGTGSDETANDGIYSATWLPSRPDNSVTILFQESSGQNADVSGAVFDIPTYTLSDYAYNWIDATAGTELDISDSDDANTEVALGFEFDFYGNTYDSVFVSSNGLLSFGSGSSDYTNDPVPSSEVPNNLIVPFWDDLYPGATPEGKVYAYAHGSAPNRSMTLSWVNVRHYTAPGEGTFQVTLHEASGDIVMQYADTDFGDASYDFGASATIGIENETGEFGVQYSYNSPEPMMAADTVRPTIGDQRAIRFSPGDAVDAVPFALNELDRTRRGFKYNNAVEYPDGEITYSFTSNGMSRTLYMRGYDVDSDIELCLYVNNATSAMSCLNAGQNNRLTPEQNFVIPFDQQVEGVNYVHVRVRNPNARWGITQVGLFDFPKNRIALPLWYDDQNRYGYDWAGMTSHPRFIRFSTHLTVDPGDANGILNFIRLRAYDIDTNDEACVYFNNQLVGCIPAGDNNRLTSSWYFFLPAHLTKQGYNSIDVKQKRSRERWGVTRARVVQVEIPEEHRGVSSINSMPPIDKLPEGYRLLK